jgi:hypothetical protein
MRLVRADELRQEGDEEDRQLGIEQVDRDRVDDDAQIGASCWRVEAPLDSRPSRTLAEPFNRRPSSPTSTRRAS